ncbi:MAG: hypothetical protein JXA14_05835 [Anaerolineae bacterium]|nr:hypothetical protein [Anaerolineae bacterium]
MRLGKQIARWLVPALLLLLIITSVTFAAAGYEIPFFIIAGGTGRVENGTYSLNATIGQPIVSQISGGSYKLCAGFGGIWCSNAVPNEVYLPIVLMEYP